MQSVLKGPSVEPDVEESIPHCRTCHGQRVDFHTVPRMLREPLSHSPKVLHAGLLTPYEVVGPLCLARVELTARSQSPP